MNNEKEIDINIKKTYISIIRDNVLRLHLHSLTIKERKTANAIMKSGKNNVIDRFMNNEMDYFYNNVVLEQSKNSFKEIIKQFLDKKG
jgi:hypothetical protein